MTAAIEDLHTVRSGRLKWSDDLALDSIDALDMVGMLEARLGIEVREEDLKAIRTVRDVVDYICIKVENGGRHDLAVQS
jgi:acyl carrier protein